MFGVVGRWRVTAGVVAAGVVVGASVVGCSSSSGQAAPASSSVVITGAAGTATVQNPASYLSLWDPCTLPMSVTDALKLGTDRDVAQLEPFQFCNMGYVGDHLGDPAYGINVGSTTQSFEQMKKDQSYQNIRMITVGDGHPAFFADSKGVGSGPGAGIVWGTSFGSVSVDISPLGGSNPFDVVPLLNKFVGLAYPYVPK